MQTLIFYAIIFIEKWLGGMSPSRLYTLAQKIVCAAAISAQTIFFRVTKNPSEINQKGYVLLEKRIYMRRFKLFFCIVFGYDLC